MCYGLASRARQGKFFTQNITPFWTGPRLFFVDKIGRSSYLAIGQCRLVCPQLPRAIMHRKYSACARASLSVLFHRALRPRLVGIYRFLGMLASDSLANEKDVSRCCIFSPERYSVSAKIFFRGRVVCQLQQNLINQYGLLWNLARNDTLGFRSFHAFCTHCDIQFRLLQTNTFNVGRLRCVSRRSLSSISSYHSSPTKSLSLGSWSMRLSLVPWGLALAVWGPPFHDIDDLWSWSISFWEQTHFLCPSAWRLHTKVAGQSNRGGKVPSVFGWSVWFSPCACWVLNFYPHCWYD